MTKLKKFLCSMADEPHEKWAWLLVVVGTAALGAKMSGLDTLADWPIFAVFGLAIAVAVWGRASKIKAGPDGIDIEQ